MGPKERLKRLETKTSTTAPTVARAVLLARVMEKLDAAAAGASLPPVDWTNANLTISSVGKGSEYRASLPPVDWTNANPATVAHRAARLRRLENRSHD